MHIHDRVRGSTASRTNPSTVARLTPPAACRQLQGVLRVCRSQFLSHSSVSRLHGVGVLEPDAQGRRQLLVVDLDHAAILHQLPDWLHGAPQFHGSFRYSEDKRLQHPAAEYLHASSYVCHNNLQRVHMTT